MLTPGRPSVRGCRPDPRRVPRPLPYRIRRTPWTPNTPQRCWPPSASASSTTCAGCAATCRRSPIADDTDAGDQAFGLNERERDSGRIAELEEELRAVGRAEERLAAGTYGLSVESGEAISDARLERLPAAERTADEQRIWERSGR